MPTYKVGHKEVLPDGSYEFTVIDANEKQSQSGNAMIELQLLIKGTTGNELRVFDHLVFTPKSFWKIDAFRVATGERLVQGQLVNFEAADCLDRTGKVLLMVEEYGGRQKNRVQEYLDPAAEKPPPSPARKTSSPVPDSDDDIPME
jgi:hypothetical protein